jgi:hypothetical protein
MLYALYSMHYALCTIPQLDHRMLQVEFGIVHREAGGGGRKVGGAGGGISLV